MGLGEGPYDRERCRLGGKEWRVNRGAGGFDTGVGREGPLTSSGRTTSEDVPLSVVTGDADGRKDLRERGERGPGVGGPRRVDRRSTERVLTVIHSLGS